MKKKELLPVAKEMKNVWHINNAKFNMIDPLDKWQVKCHLVLGTSLIVLLIKFTAFYT